MFRHGSTTRNAKYLTDSELKRMYGWSMASWMPAVYIHLSAADLNQKYQQVYGAGNPAALQGLEATSGDALGHCSTGERGPRNR
jgi:hypothetical protein